MTDRSALESFLRADPTDVGCARAMELLHVYVQLVDDGLAPEERFPGVTAHLQACGPCGEDFQGLLAAVRRDHGA